MAFLFSYSCLLTSLGATQIYKKQTSIFSQTLFLSLSHCQTINIDSIKQDYHHNVHPSLQYDGAGKENVLLCLYFITRSIRIANKIQGAESTGPSKEEHPFSFWEAQKQTQTQAGCRRYVEGEVIRSRHPTTKTGI